MGTEPLSLPRIRVLRTGHDPLELQVLNPDLLRWDVTRGKHRWPTMKEAPHLWMTFIAWAAAVRTGATSDRWETFRDVTLEVATIDAPDPTSAEADQLYDLDADGEGSSDPFLEDPEPG